MSTLDRIRYYLITAMGSRKKAAIQDKTLALSRPILEHMLKLILFGNKDESWIEDTIDWLDQIHDLYLDNKGRFRLTPHEYYVELFHPRNRVLYSALIKKVTLKVTSTTKTKLTPKLTASDSELLNKVLSTAYRRISEELTKVELNYDELARVLEELAVFV